MVVYADILMVLNLIVNYFLLLISAKLLRRKTRVVRLLISSFIGAISSLYIFLPELSVISELFLKAGICFIMAFAAFGFKGIKQFLKQSGMLFAVTCLYGGVMIAVWHIFRPYGMVVNNSVVYFNISPVALVISSVGAYLLFMLLNRIFARTAEYAGECDITVNAGEKTVTLKAILDTGNSVSDIFTQSEIIITERNAVEKLLGNTDTEQNPKIKSRFRMIPCSTVSGSDVLEGFRCDGAVVESGQGKVTIEKPILAISKTPLRDGYNAIANPQILEQAGNFK